MPTVILTELRDTKLITREVNHPDHIQFRSQSIPLVDESGVHPGAARTIEADCRCGSFLSAFLPSKDECAPILAWVEQHASTRMIDHIKKKIRIDDGLETRRRTRDAFAILGMVAHLVTNVNEDEASRRYILAAAEMFPPDHFGHTMIDALTGLIDT